MSNLKQIEATVKTIGTMFVQMEDLLEAILGDEVDILDTNDLFMTYADKIIDLVVEIAEPIQTHPEYMVHGDMVAYTEKWDDGTTMILTINNIPGLVIEDVQQLNKKFEEENMKKQREILELQLKLS